MARTLPNIIITGTPGVGKTTHAESLAERIGARHLSVNQVVKDKGCHEGWDDEYQSWIVDEDKVSFLCVLFGDFCFFRDTWECIDGEKNSRRKKESRGNADLMDYSCWMPWKRTPREEDASLTGTHVIYSPRAGSTSSWS